MSRQSESGDRSFDGIGSHFQNKIYNSPKGVIRLRVLEADLSEGLPQLNGPPLSILDAGCGLGNFSLQLAEQGHSLHLSDLSQEMVDAATALFSAAGVPGKFLHSSIQSLPDQLTSPFNLILNHAVLEWCEAPRLILQTLESLLQPGGTLSLMFYNIHGIRLRNLVRGNLRKVKSNQFRGTPGSLTPPNPLDPTDVIRWVEKLGMTILSHSGVRTFYDLLDRVPRNKIPLEDIIQQELLLRHQPPYRDMGRYIHLLCRKPDE